MRRIVPVLTVLMLLQGVQITGRAQSMHRFIFTYTGMSFGGGGVSGTGPVSGGSHVTVSLTLDVPYLRMNITTHDRNGRAIEPARGAEPAITSASGSRLLCVPAADSTIKHLPNCPNGGNSAVQSGPRLGSGTWRVTMVPSNSPGASPWNPPAKSNVDMPNGFQQFRNLPNGSRFVFKGTKVFIQDPSEI